FSFSATPVSTPSVPGDFNNDGIVDAADYVVWRRNLNGETPLLNDNSLGAPIGLNHYMLWRSNFGQPLDVATFQRASVPEPSYAELVLLALIGIVIRSPWSRGLRR